MDSPKELQNGLSICSGYEGIGLGLTLAGVRHRTICYVEIEAFAIANLVSKMEENLLVSAPVWTNLKTFPMAKFRGRVDFITAGYPCQPFSYAGQRKGSDDPRHLWPHIRRIYQTIQPGWMLFENVEGHVTLGLSTVISDLEEDGYEVEAGLFSAEEVGAPHRRNRMFILANARCIGQEPEEGFVESGEVMADTKMFILANARCIGQEPEEGFVESDEVMADTNESRPQVRDSGELPERAVKWPARPGSPQYNWEAPRVIEPSLGRAVNGSSGKLGKTTNRVDELRLLGNGVCPQQCANAYLILKERIGKIL